ncbi:sugar transferase [Candidatus Parcubacteria bacterium]|jgi:exopolysaccharide biosynthesis polyprenyl glycosylphosphotransferase|nr:sugar transferase [Candidatus Parcubacteria bacterium]
MKKADFITNIVLVPIDFVLLTLAGISAYYLRFSSSIVEIRPVFYEMLFSDYLTLVVRVAVFAILVFAVSGFYRMDNKKLARELPRIISGVSTVFVILILAIFMQRELFSSRFVIILAWVLAIAYLFISRIIIVIIRNYFFKSGHGLANIVVLGRDSNRQLVIDEYKNNPQFGFKVFAQFDDLEELKNNGDILEKINKRKIDNIIQTDSSISKENALNLLTFCQENQLSLQYAASLFQAHSLNLNFSSVAGLPIIEIQGTPLDGWRRVAKGFFDIVGSVLLVIILSPLFLVLGILVKSTSKGQIFVSLSRVGIKGKVFKMYKFRSMVKDAHKMKQEIMENNERHDGPLFKMKNDPRVTKFGRWLRRTSLDELPQLFNVLRGQMSLVGPRPHEPEEVSKYQRGYKKLLTIKPGITGMAQVSGRSNLAFAEEAKLDIFYIENWSMLLDLIILLKTPRALFRNDEAC